MTKLKQCPFCGGDRKHSADCYIPMLVEYVKKQLFLEPDYLKKLKEAWNQRAERTCKIESVTDEFYIAYNLSCGHQAIEDEPSYCPVCGAKVVG